MSEMHRRIEQVVALEPPPYPSVADQPVMVFSRQEPPAKLPDRSVALNMGGYTRADAERRRIHMNFLRPPPSAEPPDADRLATALPRRASLY
ncbi:hypothetical protein A2U01_0058898, partial [Trifolium medium]|nr:hypothetical protein [Trifolium medium]